MTFGDFSTVNPNQYVDRWRFNHPPQPFFAEGVMMYGFLFRADPSKLDRLIKRYLRNRATNYDAVELFPYVLVVFTEADRMGSIRPPYHLSGFSAEKELAIWVLVQDGLRMLWHTPYIFVDNPWACIQGREIYGFPKEMARIDVPSFDNIDRFQVDAFAIDRFSPQSEMTWREMLRVERTPTRSVTSPTRFESFEALARGCNGAISRFASTSLRELFFSESPVSPHIESETPWPPRGKFVFLKQFPDGEDGSRTCYKAITEAELTVETFREGGLLADGYRLCLPGNDSHPLFDDLGLRDKQEAALSYWLDFDFSLSGAREVWRSTPNGRDVYSSASTLGSIVNRIVTRAEDFGDLLKWWRT